MKSFSFVTFLIFVGFSKVVSCGQNGYYVDQSHKIVGGFEVTIQRAPYQAFLLIQRNFSYFYCGGSIISEEYVLTAAHCLIGSFKIFIRVGSTDMSSGGSQYISTTFKHHPRYSTRTLDFDVGFIHVPNKMSLDGFNTKAVLLSRVSRKTPPGIQLLVTGWGRTSEGSNTSFHLMAVVVPTVTQSECSKVYRDLIITRRMMCAGAHEGGKDACQGDSGGPAVERESGYQVGIVSFGLGCARPWTPGVYTNINNKWIRHWIYSNTGK